MNLEIRGDESARRVIASIRWGEPGVQGRRPLGKFIEPSLENTRAILDSSQWRIEAMRTNYAHPALTASMSVPAALMDMPRTIESLDRAMEQVRYS